jgi:hypothetical protein
MCELYKSITKMYNTYKKKATQLCITIIPGLTNSFLISSRFGLKSPCITRPFYFKINFYTKDTTLIITKTLTKKGVYAVAKILYPNP